MSDTKETKETGARAADLDESAPVKDPQSFINVLTFAIDASGSTYNNNVEGTIEEPLRFKDHPITEDEITDLLCDPKLSAKDAAELTALLDKKPEAKKDPQRRFVMDLVVSKILDWKTCSQAETTTAQAFWFGGKPYEGMSARIERYCPRCGRSEFAHADEFDDPTTTRLEKRPTAWEPARMLPITRCNTCNIPISDYVRKGTLKESPLQRSLKPADPNYSLVDAFWREAKRSDLDEKVDANFTLYDPMMAQLSTMVMETGQVLPCAPLNLCTDWVRKDEATVRMETAKAGLKPKAAIDLDDMDLGADGTATLALDEAMEKSKGKVAEAKEKEARPGYEKKWVPVDIADRRVEQAYIRNIMILVVDGGDATCNLPMGRLCDSSFGSSTAFPIFSLVVCGEVESAGEKACIKQLEEISTFGVVRIKKCSDIESAIVTLKKYIERAFEMTTPVTFKNNSDQKGKPQYYTITQHNGNRLVIPPGEETVVLTNSKLRQLVKVTKSDCDTKKLEQDRKKVRAARLKICGIESEASLSTTTTTAAATKTTTTTTSVTASTHPGLLGSGWGSGFFTSAPAAPSITTKVTTTTTVEKATPSPPPAPLAAMQVDSFEIPDHNVPPAQPVPQGIEIKRHRYRFNTGGTQSKGGAAPDKFTPATQT